MYRLVNNTETFIEMSKELSKKEVKEVYLDTETNSLDPITGTLLLIQISYNSIIFILEVQKLNKELVRKLILYLNNNFLVIGHNIKFDVKFINYYTDVRLNNVSCTMTNEVLLTAGIGKTFYSLKYLVEKYLGIILEKDTRDEFINWNGTISETQLIYSALDVFYLEKIHDTQLGLITKENMYKVYRLECELIPVVATMELNGINFSKEEWLKLKDSAQEKMEFLKVEICKRLIDSVFETKKVLKFTNAYELADKLKLQVKLKRDILKFTNVTSQEEIKQLVEEKFSLDSPLQLKTILNFIGISVDNTNEKTLRDVPIESDIITKILEFREYQKKISTYGEKFLENVNSTSNKVHTDYFNIGTMTGRLSSGHPNLQNIPRDKAYRACFKAAKGYKLVAVDYSQQELRIAGVISKEPKIIEAYQNNLDLHRLTGSIIYKKKLEEVTSEERTIAKSINFAVLYGTTEYGLAYNLKVQVDEARKLISNFYLGYPTLSEFKNQVEKFILNKYYSISQIGRKRFFEKRELFDIGENIGNYYNRIRREGFNFLVQGGGADQVKLAMVALDKENPFGDKFRLLLQIHDEIVAEAEESIAKEASEFMVTVMERIEQEFLGDIPAKADASEPSDHWLKG